MKLLLILLILTASLFAATQSSDKVIIDDTASKVRILNAFMWKQTEVNSNQEKANEFNLQLHSTSTKTDENQNDAIAELQEKITKLEKQIKILEKRIK